MKKVIFALMMIILYFQGVSTQNLTQVQSTEMIIMNVVAPSGLTMRATPSMDGEVLYIIPTRSAVIMSNDEMVSPVLDEVGYMQGSWVFVEYEGQEGYVFDGFLTSLPLPIHEFEMTQFDLDLIFPLESYIDYHKLIPLSTDSISTDLYSKVIHQYEDGSKMIQKNTMTQYHLKVQLVDADIWDAYHILLQMMSTRSEMQRFMESATFVANSNGLVDKIKIDLPDPVTIKMTPTGMVEIQVYSDNMGCTVDVTRS
ncbi:MAG: SH3 domain-containing protein [Saprospiraceae bacterium]|nr:SH3 domain-containing protein [Saprospiraceae bacterium]